jgi:hypothetical protein
VIKLTIDNRIINGSFETGGLTPWSGFDASITTMKTHSGYYSALLSGGASDAYVYQIVPVNPGENFEFLVSLAKVGTDNSPPVAATVAYYDVSFSFLGYGLIVEIPSDGLPDNHEWLVVYQTTSPAPTGTTQALVLVVSLPEAGTSDVLADDVALLSITGPTGALVSNKFFSTAGSGTVAGGDLTISANRFTDDNGTTITAFPSYDYFNLYINGLLQPNGITTLSTSEVVINGGSILEPGVPITVELVRSL